jgi:hypothetical protein
MRSRLGVLMFLLGAWAIAGCGSSSATPTDAPVTGTVNPVQEGDLARTVAIEILELDESQASGGYMQRPAIVDPAVLEQMVAALDSELPLGPRVRTPAHYRLRFVRDDGVVVELGYRADPGTLSFLRGDQDSWQGGDAQPPAGFDRLMAEQLAAMPPDAGDEEPVGPPDPARARDQALAYLAEAYGEQPPGPGVTWTEEDLTPEGLVGAAGRQYTAGEWTVTVRFPVVAPEAMIYQVTVENEASGFGWEGQVDARGAVTEP